MPQNTRASLLCCGEPIIVSICGDHGARKAAYFEQRGFSLEDWEVLQQALLSHGKTSKITRIEKHEYGTKIVVECMLSSPAGNDHCIRSVWNCRGDGAPARLITAHPL